VESTPLLVKVKVVVLSIAQQEGRTLIIVVKDKLPKSVVAVELKVAIAPGTGEVLLSNCTVTSPAAVVGAAMPLKLT
jgi:hypothetical protein